MTVVFLNDNETVPEGEYGDFSANGNWPIAYDEAHDGYKLQGGCNLSHCKLITSDIDSDGSTIVARTGNDNKFIRINVDFNDDWDYDKNGSKPCIDRPRVQLNKKNIGGSGNGVFQFGTEYWVGFSVYLPQSHVADFKQENLWGLLGENNTNQGVSVYTRDGDWRIIHEQIDTNGSKQVTALYVTDYLADRGAWVDWAFNVKFAETGGFIYVYKNKTLVGQITGRTVHESHKSPYMSLVGPKIYKPGWRHGASDVTERIVYFDEQRQSDNTSSAGLDEVSPGGAVSLIASGDSYSVNAGETLVVAAPGVMENDSFPTGTIAVLDQSPNNGSLDSFGQDGAFQYTHDGGASTEDTIKYHLEDPDGNVSNIATITLTINQTATGGSISTTETEVTTNVALQNWGQWSYIGYSLEASVIHKSGGNGLVSNVVASESLQGTHNIDFSWLSGDLVESESSVGLGWKLQATTEQIEFDLDADGTERTPSLWVTALNCTAEVRLSLNDSSAVDNIDNLIAPSLVKKTWRIDMAYTAGSTTKLHATIKPKNPQGDTFLVIVGVVAANEGADSGNQAPTVTGPSNFSVNEMEEFEILFQGSDPDDSPVSPLNFNLTEAPDIDNLVSFPVIVESDGNNNTIRWRPDKGDVGEYTFRGVVDDGDKTAEDNVQVTVNSGSTRVKANDKKVIS